MSGSDLSLGWGLVFWGVGVLGGGGDWLGGDVFGFGWLRPRELAGGSPRRPVSPLCFPWLAASDLCTPASPLVSGFRVEPRGGFLPRCTFS